MPGDMACHHYQILNDRPYPASFYRVLHGMGRTDALVTNHTQDVIGRHRKLQHKLICVELPRREPFQSHVRLDLTVELFAFPMRMIKGNYFPVSKIHIDIPHVDFHLCRKKILSPFVDAALYYFIHGTDRKWMLFSIGTSIGNITPGRSYINGLPIPWTGDIQTFIFQFLQPSFFAFSAEIAFGYKRAPVFQKNTDVLCRIVSGIQTEQRGSFVTLLHASMVSLRNSGVCFWQCWLPLRNSQLMR